MLPEKPSTITLKISCLPDSKGYRLDADVSAAVSYAARKSHKATVYARGEGDELSVVEVRQGRLFAEEEADEESDFTTAADRAAPTAKR